MFLLGWGGASMEGWAAPAEEGNHTEEDGQGRGEEAATDQDQGPESSWRGGQG